MDVSSRLTRWAKALWRVAAGRPLLLLLPLYLLQTGLTLNARRLWFSDEVRYADALTSLLNGGHWLVLHMNGQAYPDKPPLYFWLLAALRPLAGGVNERLFFLGAAVSGLALLAATLWLARTVSALERAGTGAERDRPDGLTAAAGLALLASPFLAVMTHYSRMDLLFAAFIVAGQTCFLRAMLAPGAPPGDTGGRWPLAAFGLAGLATLTKGPLGIGLPLAGLLAFAAITGRWRRLLSARMAQGLGIYALIVVGWLLAALAVEGREFIQNILGHQVVARAMDAWHHREGWGYYLPVLPAAMLPWTLLPLAGLAPAASGQGAGWFGRAWERRDSAWGYVWCMFLGGFGLLNAISIKIPVYLLPLLPPAAVLAAGSLLRQTGDAGMPRRFWLLAAGFLGLLAVAAPFADFLPLQPASLRGLGLVTLLAGLGGWLVFQAHGRLRGLSGAAPLPALALAMSLAFLPMGALTAPSLDAIMSPREQALRLGALVEQGYAPASYRVYPGVYSYYAGAVVPDIPDMAALTAFLASHPKAAVAMPEKRWKQWDSRPQGLVVAHVQRIVGDNFVLVVQGGG